MSAKYEIPKPLTSEEKKELENYFEIDEKDFLRMISSDVELVDVIHDKSFGYDMESDLDSEDPDVQYKMVWKKAKIYGLLQDNKSYVDKYGRYEDVFLFYSMRLYNFSALKWVYKFAEVLFREDTIDSIEVYEGMKKAAAAAPTKPKPRKAATVK